MGTLSNKSDKSRALKMENLPTTLDPSEPISSFNRFNSKGEIKRTNSYGFFDSKERTKPPPPPQKEKNQ